MRRRWIAAPLALLACDADDVKVDPLDSEDSAVEARDPRFDALAAAMQSSLEASDAPGAAIAVFEGGEVVWAEGFGVTAPGGDTPVGPETLFRIGSVTKMMTAVALLQQQERGLVDFDAPITAAVPELDFALDESWAGAIYPEHLITHTAGLFDYGELSSGPADEGLAEQLLGYYDDTYWLMSPPGAIWNYSNPNFSLAGLAAEQVDGRWYRELMMEDVFAPLGMDRTFFLGEEVLADGDWAAGRGPDWTTGTRTVTIEADSYDSAFMRPAGFAWSSVLDLADFAQLLLHGEPAVLSEAHRQAMTSAQVPLDMGIEGQGYGYGLFIAEGFFLGSDYYDERLWSHGGDINGYAADLYILPEQDLGFAILASGSGAHLSEAVAEGLRLGVGEPAEAPDLTVDPASYARYAGTYDDPYNVGRMIFTETESGLSVDMPRLDLYDVPYSSEVIPYLPGVFVLTVQGYQIPLSFIEDEGAPRWARTRVFVAERSDEAQALVADPGPGREAVERALRRLAETPEPPAVLRPPMP
ncbi:MAG: beta-lactamase family protein [Alphaproteobacteria bacterium]|nr:beta-lactamase family protein [Alphaproteobacteria bacterium]